MQYALYLPPAGPYSDPNTLVELARDAEQAGWDGFFIWDHVVMWLSKLLPVADPWVALAAIAATTERIRFGPMVTPLARRRPWKLAREAVTLDQLSGGRLILGVGLGGGAHEFDDLGELSDPKDRAVLLDQSLDVLAGLWRGEPFSYESEYYYIHKAHFLPTPVQQPRIPIWVAGFWPNKPPLRRAACWDGVFPLLMTDEPPFDLTIEQVKEMLDYIREHRPAEMAGAPFDVVFSYSADMDLAREAEVAAQYAEVGVTWWFEQINPWRFGWDGEGEWPVEAMRERVLMGPPQG